MTDEATFTDYVVARRPQLFRTACLLCGDPHRAEDIVQDVLSRLYPVWDRVSRMDNVDAYVRRSLVNAHLSDRRRPWRRESSPAPREIEMRPGFPSEDAEAIRTSLRSLPPGQRRVIVLRHICGLTVEQTAAELGISPGTVKSQASDATRTLRRALAPDFRPATAQGEQR